MIDDPNIQVVTDRYTQAWNQQPDAEALQFMRQRSYAVDVIEPSLPIAGIDSSDNILLQIPDLPGAGVAGYAFTLVVSDPNGQPRMVRERAVEHYDDPHRHEDLLIEILYEIPTQEERRILSYADYQWRTLMSGPSGRIPYLDEYPLFKLRIAAARARDLTERRATRIFLNQDDVRVSILLKDGRLSSQNCSTRYTDDLARLFVRRNVRWVGVVKQGSALWEVLRPYHRALSKSRCGRPYWAQIPPQLVWQAYANDEQSQPKTLLLGARESQSLGGVGGLWVLYAPAPGVFYVLEFNVYDMEVFRPLVESGAPLQRADASCNRPLPLHVVRERSDGTYDGALTAASARDFEVLVTPTVAEIHHYATVSSLTLNYPIVLADAHNRCKITRERKERKNWELKAEFMRRGYHPVDFAEFEEDPHKLFER